MTDDQRIRRNLVLAAVVGPWLVVVTARALGLIDWPWVWVLAPYWVPLAASLLLLAVVVLATMAMRFFLWLLECADRRRREREARQFRRAVETGLRDLVGSRSLRFQGEESSDARRPRP